MNGMMSGILWHITALGTDSCAHNSVELACMARVHDVQINRLVMCHLLLDTAHSFLLLLDPQERNRELKKI